MEGNTGIKMRRGIISITRLWCFRFKFRSRHSHREINVLYITQRPPRYRSIPPHYLCFFKSLNTIHSCTNDKLHRPSTIPSLHLIRLNSHVSKIPKHTHQINLSHTHTSTYYFILPPFIPSINPNPQPPLPNYTILISSSASTAFCIYIYRLSYESNKPQQNLSL